jgi:conjugative relaxase-like TrwC/TraI family protein
VLSIGKLTGGADSARYYERRVASGREDYYSGRGESAGRWAGDGARLLGLEGEVAAGELEALLVGGTVPGSAEPLRLTATTVQGFDLTFSAPKSVSVLYAVGNEEVRRGVVDAHEQAVEQALGYLEREAVQVRRGRGGWLKEHGGGLVAGAYRHRTSRAGDPQLHTHVVAANLARGADGRWTALHAAPLYTHAKTAGYLYQSALRDQLTHSLGVRWGAVSRGSAEITGVPGSVLEHFSQRRAEIREAMAQRGSAGSDAARVAALDTRRAKEYRVQETTIYEVWRARAAEHGLDRDAVAGLLGHEPPQPGEEQVRRAAALMAGEAGLTARASTFTRREALQAWAEQHPQGAPVARVEALADTWLASELVVKVDGDAVARSRSGVIATRAGTRVAEVDERYSTPGMLETERRLVDASDERRATGAGVADPGAVETALAARPFLADEQAAMVRALTGSGDGVQVVLAKAGAGKTTALDAAREAWQRSGIGVQGTALGSMAAKELRDSGVQACTIARLLLDVQQYGLPRGSVLIVDEAGMVGTRTLALLAEHAQAAGAKLVLVGDDKQLPEIDAGGAFRGLAQRLGAVELQHNRRQRDPEDRRALDEHRAGHPDELVESLRRRGRVSIAPDVQHTRQSLVSDWWQGAQAEGIENAVMIALRRSEVRELNDLARERMRQDGRLGDRELVVEERAFAVGDRVVTRQNAPALGVVNGSRGTITHIDQTGARLRLDGDREVQLPAGYLAGYRGHQAYLEHGYAITANGIQGGTTQRSYVLGSEELYQEWGYVAFSRHRVEARFYVTAPDVPEHEQLEFGAEPGDPLREIVRALGQSRAKGLAIDVQAAGEMRAMPDERLVSETAHLRSLLEHAPQQRADIDALDAQRAQTADELAAARGAATTAEHELHSAGWRERRVARERLEGARAAVDTWQARLEDLDNRRAELVDRMGDPDAWLAAHRDGLARLAAAETELARRQRVTRGEALRWVTVEPPMYVTNHLGPRPEDPTRRAAWDRAARTIETYRQRPGVSICAERSGLGDVPAGDRDRRAFFAADRRLRPDVELLRGAPEVERPAVDLGPSR